MQQAMLAEFHQELSTTEKLLNCIPADKLGWKPHETSLALGQLAMHIAQVPGAIAALTAGDSFDVQNSVFIPAHPKSVDEIHAALRESARNVDKTLQETTDERAQAMWHLMHGDREVMTAPRSAIWRSLLLNHWYHHRGQLSVYLRMLGVHMPSIYGPSADESPFA